MLYLLYLLYLILYYQVSQSVKSVEDGAKHAGDFSLTDLGIFFNQSVAAS